VPSRVMSRRETRLQVPTNAATASLALDVVISWGAALIVTAIARLDSTKHVNFLIE
jgi:hypothetical protein